MSAIYEPKGKAREYSPLALNLYEGCGHGCVYCYARMIRRQSYGVFTNATPRKDIFKKLNDDLQKWKGRKDIIMLCFMCDPYQPIDIDLKFTRRAILALNRYGFPVQILTKGGMRATRDFDILAQNPSNKFAVTLTTDDPTESPSGEFFCSASNTPKISSTSSTSLQSHEFTAQTGFEVLSRMFCVILSSNISSKGETSVFSVCCKVFEVFEDVSTPSAQG
jgi:hypothetical protein